MSLPMFPQIDPPLTREESLNEIISSIASEELSLSHILNAPCQRWELPIFHAGRNNAVPLW